MPETINHSFQSLDSWNQAFDMS